MAMADRADPEARRRELEELVFGLGERLRAERASLFCVDETRDTFRIEVARPEGGLELDAHIPMLRGIVGHAWFTGKPVHVGDAYGDPRFCADVDRASGFRTRSVLAVPIYGGSDDVVAVLELLNHREGAGFTDADVEEVRASVPELLRLLDAAA